MKYFITGGAGFIGSNLVDMLLALGHNVVIYDNFSTGSKKFITQALASTKAELIRGDLLNIKLLSKSIKGCDFVFHLAANADVRFGVKYPRKDLEQNTIATFNVLEAMRQNGIKKIAFSSTGSIYGEPKVLMTLMVDEHFIFSKRVANIFAWMSASLLPRLAMISAFLSVMLL